ncbi:MAG TPA: LiaF domain-containing protein [Euzebyales bacterium]|nr:LiaF domain-containing protein [Euzebyales bacterium]
MSGSASAATPDPNGDGGRQDARAPQDRPAADSAAAAAPPPPVDRAPPQRPDADAGARDPGARDPDAGARDPYADFLITSQERDAAEARLRQAVADEMLTLDEFGDRMRALLDARTRGDLQQAVAGLPIAAEPLRRSRERGTARPARKQQHIIAVMSEEAARGRWRPAPETTAVGVMGNAIVDLQGAEYEGDELKISAMAFMGSVEIIVPEGVEVELSGFAIMGDRSNRIDAPVLPDAPLVRVDAYAVMGAVEVRHPKRKERIDDSDERGAFADRVPVHGAGHHRSTMAHRSRRSTLAAARRWVVGLLAAAAIAVPFGWVLASDDVAGAVFGGTEHVVNTQGLTADEELEVGAPVAFGSVSIQVPEGVNVERDGMVIFGSTECPACNAQFNPDAPTVRVKTFGGFGSVEINRVGAPGADLD